MVRGVWEGRKSTKKGEEDVGRNFGMGKSFRKLKLVSRDEMREVN